MAKATNNRQPAPADRTKRVDWSAVPIVFVTLPTCRHCGSPDYTTSRSEASDDGSTTRKAICDRCSRPFKICCELPESGNGG